MVPSDGPRLDSAGGHDVGTVGVSARRDRNSTLSETYDLNICTDCLMMLAKGDVGDRGDIGALTEYQQDEDDAHLYNLPGDDQWNNANTRHAARMNAHWPGEDGWVIVCGDSDEDQTFSWLSCQGCESSLGGYRAAAHAFRRVQS